MKLSDIIRQVNRDTEQVYSNADITDWVNRCLDELTPIAQKGSKKTTSLVDTNAYSLPDDLFQIVKITIDNDEYDYTVFADELSVVDPPKSGDMTLYYVRNLNHLDSSTLDGVPEIEVPFHDLFILYATYMSQYKEEETMKQSDAYNRYVQRRQDYESFINRNKLRPETIYDVYGVN